MRSARSNTTTSCPARVSCCAAASPAGPEPTTATRLPVCTAGDRGATQPSSHARSTISTSTCLIVTGSLVDAEHARRLARRRAQPAGELGEVVGRVQALDRVAPVVAVDEVVPVGDEVAERAAVVAERDAAVHAPPGLLAQRRRSGTARRPRASRAGAPAPAAASGVSRVPLQEPGGLTHGRPPSPAASVSSSARPAASASRITVEHALVVLGHDLAERRDRVVPVVEQPLGDRRARSRRDGGCTTSRAATRGRASSSGSSSTIS